MEQRLYAQVVMLIQKDFKFTAENKNRNEAKFKFQGQSAISQRWFGLEFDWIGLMLAHVNLISMRNFFGAMKMHKIKIHLKF